LSEEAHRDELKVSERLEAVSDGTFEWHVVNIVALNHLSPQNKNVRKSTWQHT
jgi:hypothetical protein